jgi:hypothetical protein
VRALGILWIAVVAACGPPIARNVPQPNTAAAAGIAAGAAAAITLADPQAAARQQEERKIEDEKRPQRVKSTVPADVFDRLDAKQREASSGPPGER